MKLPVPIAKAVLVGLLATPALGQTPAPASLGAAPTTSLEQALKAIESRNFEKALTLIIPLTDKGDAEALFLRGLLNESGVVRGAAPERAAVWYEKSAAAGNTKAQNNLGAMYYDGRGVAQNLALARMWYGRAAEQGNPPAQFNYALMLGQGLGTDNPENSRDPAAMMQWLARAAAQRYARAQLQLGKLYLAGGDVPADSTEAAYWLRLAAEQDSAEAQYLFGELLQKGEGVPRDLAAAIDWFERASSGGIAAASYELGVIYELGLGVVADAQKSTAYYQKAAEAGYAKAIEKMRQAR